MKILLACSAGMSTSLLVRKMVEAANERALPVQIDAYGVSRPVRTVPDILDDWDVLLLGPQVRYLEKEYKPLCEQKGKGFGVIPMQTYGRMDGKGCMELARTAAANK